MAIYIEQGPRGPSKLDEKVESLSRDSEGNIWLHPQEARNLLFSGLLAFYKGQMAERDEALREVVSPGLPLNVEALAQIANLDGETRLVNLRRIKEEIVSRRVKLREEQIAKNIARFPKALRAPPQAEF